MKLIRLLLLSFTCTLMLTSVVRAQNISEIAKSDPLIITGAVGTQNTYHYTSVGDGYASPLSNSVYADLNISLFGISMPFSFYYTNDNTSFSYPQISFNLTPRYKNWVGHIGRSSMEFSPYILNEAWNGVGLEYISSGWHAGAFYGTLRNAINEDPYDPASRRPQFKRKAWGFKAGYGKASNYINIYLMRAYDCLNTVDEPWREKISPEENILVGVNGCVTPLPWMSFSANVATSVFSTDTRMDKVEDSQAQKWDKIFDVRYSSLMRFAGDATLSLLLPLGINTSISYKMVQPDYKSLGTYYMSNNYQSLGVTASTTLFNKVSLSGTYAGQSDNLTNKQMFTTSGYLYSLSASSRIGSHFNIFGGVNGYTQRQSDGTCKVNDTTRVHRQMLSFSLTPTYMIENELFGHSVSLSANYTTNKDLNDYSESINHSNVTTNALGLSYGLNVKPWEMDFSLALSHQQTKGYNTEYRSEVASLSASRSFLEEKNLNLSGIVSLCYNEVYHQSKSLSMGGDISVGYTINKVHNISASAGFNKYGDVNISNVRSDLDCLDISCSLNYSYTFTLVEIKNKEKKSQKEQTTPKQ